MRLLSSFTTDSSVHDTYPGHACEVALSSSVPARTKEAKQTSHYDHVVS